MIRVDFQIWLITPLTLCVNNRVRSTYIHNTHVKFKLKTTWYINIDYFEASWGAVEHNLKQCLCGNPPMTFLSGCGFSSTGAEGGALCASASVMLAVRLLQFLSGVPSLLIYPKLFFFFEVFVAVVALDVALLPPSGDSPPPCPQSPADRSGPWFSHKTETGFNFLPFIFSYVHIYTVAFQEIVKTLPSVNVPSKVKVSGCHSLSLMQF